MLVVAGAPVPGTSWCVGYRESGLEFVHGKGARRRVKPCSMGVGHWTGGEAGTTSSSDDGKRVYDVLRARDLSVHFTIGYDGTVWQYADPATVVCYHAGAVNELSWGVECVNKGLPPDAGRARETIVREAQGRPLAQLAFTSPQLAAFVRLCDTVQAALALPRAVPALSGKLATKRIEDARLARFEGVVEHLHASSQKVDAGTQLVHALASAGYSLVDV